MALETTLRCRRLALAWLAAWALALPSAAPAAGSPEASWRADSLEALVARFRAMPGFSARFDEDKTIALLERPLRSSGRLAFVPPQLLVRRVEEPAASLLRLDGDELLWADGSGSERIDLGASPTARAFAHTFTDVLAGDLPRLRASYDISFRPEGADPTRPGSAWRLELTPRDADLARVIDGVSIRGHGVVPTRLEVREASGDVTVTRFHDVDSERRFEEPEITRLLRPPGS